MLPSTTLVCSACIIVVPFPPETFWSSVKSSGQAETSPSVDVEEEEKEEEEEEEAEEAEEAEAEEAEAEDAREHERLGC